jgi:hypothetical protein
VGDIVFAGDAVETNRNGQLTREQASEVEGMLDRRHGGITGLIGRALDPIAKDLREGRVETIEGPARDKPPSDNSWRGDVGTHYRIQIANSDVGTEIFRSPKAIFEFARLPSALRLYYLPRSRWIVNAELLADPPVQDLMSAQGGLQAMLGALAGLRDPDPVAAANARVRTAALGREVDQYLTRGTAPPAQRAAPEALTAALVGTWANPLVRATFRSDGTVSAHLPDGSERDGRWSVDREGRLHGEAGGKSIVGDASLEADRLTLYVLGHALTLQRADVHT